jgi:hypothetical protein
MSPGNILGSLLILCFFSRTIQLSSDCKERLSSKASRDEQSAQRLWKLSEEMTHLNDALKELRDE